MRSQPTRAPFQILVFPFIRTGQGPIEYAIFRRRDGEYWQGIAGGGENAETPLETARRETEEESGIAAGEFMALSSMATVPVTAVTGEFTWGKGIYVLPEHAFGVRVQDKRIVLSGEHTEYRWVDYDTAVPMLKYDSNRNALWELNARLSDFNR